MSVILGASGHTGSITSDSLLLEGEKVRVVGEVADGDLVTVHGRFSGFGAPVNWIAADILRIEDGALVEHWDVIQEEATREQSQSGQPMFGDSFPLRR